MPWFRGGPNMARGAQSGEVKPAGPEPMMTTLAWVILPIEKRPLLRLRARVQQTGSRCSMQSALADCANLAADRALTRNAALSRRPAGTTGLKACAGWRAGPETVCRCHNLWVPSSYARYADQNATGL